MGTTSVLARPATGKALLGVHRLPDVGHHALEAGLHDHLEHAQRAWFWLVVAGSGWVRLILAGSGWVLGAGVRRMRARAHVLAFCWERAGRSHALKTHN